MMRVSQTASGSGAFVHAGPNQLSSARTHFSGTQLDRPKRCAGVARKQVVAENFKFMKKLGLKKPAFLPDFGLVSFGHNLSYA